MRPAIGAMVAGFPGAWRRPIASDTLDLPGATMLALIHHVRETEFVCQLDPAFVDRDRVDYAEDIVADEQLPGMSGGPALLVRRDPILVPHLCGILKQGTILAGSRLLAFARLDRVRPDGTIQP
jgi:hypothetical protein